MGKCALETFSLESDQSLPLELVKYDPLDRREVVIGVCIALRDPVLAHIPTKSDLARGGWGGREESWI